ncbi:Protein of unknown function [Lactobacillus acidophilus DSM 9126]|nr:Protein of unknown function [Lactobacillus acidophilus DSM 20079 = JCM 1132 = NBRC 13951 = CIP 76.13]CDF68916.1 Protein of unknown function [Lactobacillus acidophilus CIRM-BIA 442]CDF72509.1 Protein of unknown function [Lactobacillus acidophilus DSM 9126]CDF74476.1 Protein of unknown function [Lactobacillus acidophilus DSM 20242]
MDYLQPTLLICMG